MKKNVFLKLASALLVLCLASTCAIGTTFAKYTTADSAADTARVAKWGITVSTSGTLFGKFYQGTTDDSITDSSINVASSASLLGTENVVAPGTKNFTGFQVKLSGQPEVQYEVSASATGIKDIVLRQGSYGVMVKVNGLNAATNLNGLYSFDGTTTYTKITTDILWTSGDYYELHDAADVSTGDYYPIKWSIAHTGADGVYTATNATNLETVVNNWVTAIDGIAGNANNLLEASYTLTWEWPWENNNAADTILGNLMASVDGIVKTTDAGATYVAIGTGDYNLNINFNISVGVDQVN